MHIANHSIFINDGFIILRIEGIWIDHGCDAAFKTLSDFTLFGVFSNTFTRHPNSQLSREEGRRQEFEIQLEGKKIKGAVLPVQYQLPTDPERLLNFFIAYEMFTIQRFYSNIRLVDYCLKDKLQQQTIDDIALPQSVEDLLKTGIPVLGKSGSMLLMERILSLPTIPAAYNDAILVIKAVYEYRKKCNGLAGQGNATEERIKLMRALVRHALGHKSLTKNIFNLSHVISHLNLLAIVQLYAPCVGKVADDKGVYHFNYAEWYVLRHADFTLRPDGRVNVLLKDNAGNKAHYFPNGSNFQIMEREFRHLAYFLNLEFDAETDVHKEFVFTPACSERLINMGLHLTTNYCKRLLRLEREYHFFRQAKDENLAPGNNFNLLRLPGDLLDIVFNYIYGLQPFTLHSKEQQVIKELAYNFKQTPLVSLFPPALKLEMQEAEKVVEIRPAP